MDQEDRVAVKTYVPRRQKELWADHADELGMSQSEFVRTMVQAGRVDFEVPGFDHGETTSGPSGDGEGIAERVEDALGREDVMDWDALVSALVDDVEADLDDALERLQDDNRVRYSGRDGGYVLMDDE